MRGNVRAVVKWLFIVQGLCPWTPAGHCMPSKLGGTRLNPS